MHTLCKTLQYLNRMI